METKQPKTFEEIDRRLENDLKKINEEIAEIENFIAKGEELLEIEVAKGASDEVLAKYRTDIKQLQKGLEMFLGIKDEIEQTRTRLHETKAQADEHIK